MFDQSTQVNFPIVVRKLFKTRTSDDLLTSQHHHHHQLHLQPPNSSWIQLRPTMPRPKSMNFATAATAATTGDAFEKSKIFYTSECPLRSNHEHKETTSPFSSNSSYVGSTTERRKCHRACVRSDSCSLGAEAGPRPGGAATSRDLSWRRLHMSRAKLKATATTSELLSGFAMVAMVELQINEPTNVPEWLFVVFAVCTTVLVAVHIFALMISTYILPNIDAIAKLDQCEMVSESPHERMRGFIQLAWAFSTVLGLFLFLVEVAILCWVKFWDYSFAAAMAATIVVIPVLIVFILFAIHFYHSLVVHKCNASTSDIRTLEDMKRHLDQINHIKKQ